MYLKKFNEQLSFHYYLNNVVFKGLEKFQSPKHEYSDVIHMEFPPLAEKLDKEVTEGEAGQIFTNMFEEMERVSEGAFKCRLFKADSIYPMYQVSYEDYPIEGYNALWLYVLAFYSFTDAALADKTTIEDLDDMELDEALRIIIKITKQIYGSILEVARG